MTTRIKVYIAVLCTFILMLAFSRFSSYKDDIASQIITQEKARVEAKYQKDIKDLNDKIAAKQTELKQSEKRATAYRDKLTVADAKIRLITKPATITETKERLNALGYDVLPSTDVCVSEGSGKEIVVNLEKEIVEKEELATAKELNTELDGQIVSKNDIITLKDAEITAANGMVESQKQIMSDQEKVCDEKIKNAKPSIVDGLIKIIGGVGIGVLIGLLLL